MASRVANARAAAASNGRGSPVFSPATRAEAHTRPYNVGRSRVRKQVVSALASNDLEAQLRRLNLVIPACAIDPGNADIRELAQSKVAEITHRLQGSRAGQSPEMCPIDPESLGRAPQDPEHGGWDWIRKKNAESDRKARRQVSDLTQLAVKSRGYSIGQGLAILEHVDSMIEGTRLVSPTLGDWPASYAGAPLATWTRSTELVVEEVVVLEAATKLASSGKHVVAVNAAAAYHSGGGFLTGGRHALEEAMCIQSTLYTSLERAERLAEAAGVKAPEWAKPDTRGKGGSPWHAHIPQDGCVLSPNVEVFRGGTNDGYPFEEQPVALDGVVSVAMPNCNERMSDSPTDAHPETKGYMEQLTQKWRATLIAAARYTRAECLVVPDAGCGVFMNPPEKVGEALGTLLRTEFEGRFEKVVIAFPGGRNGETFADAAFAAAGRKRSAAASTG
eukprot:TRINITY_DN24329_c0_g1_i1.p1 TRINITY_DN24329_c0_g1~~TRINITY_DN24329_c0_g1_i1.p1  ORF type:complete len:447 (-),score=65.94 TRINITY_DN24329_c0_g1_i1:275-1615(-)